MSNYHYIKITSDNRIEVVHQDSPDLSVAVLEQAVGGDFDITWACPRLPFDENLRLIINEEGEKRNLPLNCLGTVICGNPIYGDIVLGTQTLPDEDSEIIIYAFPEDEYNSLFALLNNTLKLNAGFRWVEKEVAA